MTGSKRTIIIGSLQFSPIYKSHCCALGALAEKNGLEVSYAFSRKYEWMLPEAIKKKTWFIGRTSDIPTAVADSIDPRNYRRITDMINRERPDFVYMYNFHPLFNGKVASAARKSGSTYIQHIHEPYYENKKVYGGLMRYWLYLFEVFQGNLLGKTDIVIVSSRISRELFGKRYPEFRGRIIEAPLLYEDLGPMIRAAENPEYVTLVGPPFPAKGPEIFLSLAGYAEEHLPGLKFQIISRSPVRDPVFYRFRNLRIVYRDRISDEELGSCLSRSIAVITPYKAGTQSSVAVTANMLGIPVLSSDVGGLPEFVRHKETGYLVDIHAPVEKWVEGLDYIIAHRSTMTATCRQFFVEGFSGSAWQKYFDDIFKGPS